jgi:2-oxoglutarate ferredoxin oxidoreductase subunit delta
VPQVVVNTDWCKGCHICVQVCPKSVLEVDEASFVRGFHPVRVARPEDCTACLQCELLCPDLAIMVTGDRFEGANELAPPNVVAR